MRRERACRSSSSPPVVRVSGHPSGSTQPPPPARVCVVVRIVLSFRAPGQPSGSRSAPAAARTRVIVSPAGPGRGLRPRAAGWSCASQPPFSRWGPLPCPCRRGGPWWWSSPSPSAVGVGAVALAGADAGRGIHRSSPMEVSRCRRCAGPSPRGCLRSCSSFVSRRASRWGRCRSRGRRGGWWSRPSSLSPGEGVSRWGPCGRRSPRGPWCGCSSPSPGVSRWGRWRSRARRGCRWSRAWGCPLVSRCRPCAGRRPRGCCSACPSASPGQPLSSMRRPARTVVGVLIVRLLVRWSQPLGSIMDPSAARTAELVSIAASPVGVYGAADGRAQVRVRAHRPPLSPWGR